MKCLLDLRCGFVPHDDMISLMEKNLITILLAPDPSYRPKSIKSIAQIVNCIVNEVHSSMDIPYSQFEQTYTIGSFLGEGQDGKCWKVKNKNDDKEYALILI